MMMKRRERKGEIKWWWCIVVRSNATASRQRGTVRPDRTWTRTRIRHPIHRLRTTLYGCSYSMHASLLQHIARPHGHHARIHARGFPPRLLVVPHVACRWPAPLHVARVRLCINHITRRREIRAVLRISLEPNARLVETCYVKERGSLCLSYVTARFSFSLSREPSYFDFWFSLVISSPLISFPPPLLLSCTTTSWEDRNRHPFYPEWHRPRSPRHGQSARQQDHRH